jgi:hypothetical protein
MKTASDPPRGYDLVGVMCLETTAHIHPVGSCIFRTPRGLNLSVVCLHMFIM